MAELLGMLFGALIGFGLPLFLSFKVTDIIMKKTKLEKTKFNKFIGILLFIFLWVGLIFLVMTIWTKFF
ncbi:MAG: hypothetical protein IPL09_11965 [Bacteroidetes bacterium]|nr:hypothetical protein [Bacteroidota bacterium]